MKRAATGGDDVARASARADGRPDGLTLVEVVVALSIASLITLALGQLLRGTRASEAAVNRALDPLQALDLAAELLSEEVSLAANLVWPAPTVIADLPAGVDARAFVTPGLVVEAGPDGDRVRVSYVDDRLADGPRARIVTYEAGPDSAGEPQLFRRPGASSRQPIVAGVESLSVVAVVRTGTQVAPSAVEVGAPVSAVVLRLYADGKVREVVIELPARPVVELAP